MRGGPWHARERTVDARRGRAAQLGPADVHIWLLRLAVNTKGTSGGILVLMGRREMSRMLAMPRWMKIHRQSRRVAMPQVRAIAAALVVSYVAATAYAQNSIRQSDAQEPPPDSERLLADALSQARQENKRVFFVVTGENCGPCVLMSRFLDRYKTIIDQDFIVVKIGREQDSASDAVIRRVRAGKPGGIPWVAILDGGGAVLATSNDADGKNLGFPHEELGIECFMNMISSTSRRIPSNQLMQLEESLRRNTILKEFLQEHEAKKLEQANQERK
jgi:hypothetical protein